MSSLISPAFVDEAARLRELADYQILDSLPEQSFDRLTRLAAHVFDVPTALISLVDEDRQWFKSRVGLDACQTPRDVSFCTHALGAGEALVVSDALQDSRFAENPLVTGAPFIRFYAGAPLRTKRGFDLGTLCLLDTKPREFSPSERERLRDLAAMVVDELELRRASRELAESEGRFRALIEGTSDIITVLDERGVIRFESPSLERVMGWAPAEMVGKSALDFIHPDDQARVAQRMRLAIAGELAFDSTLVFRSQARDGSYRTLEAVARNCFDNPAIGGLVVNSRDVSEREQMQNTLRENQNHLQLALEAGRMGLWQAPVPAQKSNWSPQMEALHGFAPGEFSGKYTDFLARVHPDDAPRLVELTAAAIDEGQQFIHEYRSLWPDGTLRWIESRGVPLVDEGGKPQSIVGVNLDISERKAAEVALRQSEERFKSAFGRSAIGMALVSPDGRWFQVNSKLCEILGYSEREMLQTTFQQITFVDDLNADLELLKQLVAGEIASYQMEKRYIHRDEHLVWTLLDVALVRDERGEPLHFVSQVQDISERKRVEAEHLAATEALQISETRGRAILESSLDAIITIDERGDVCEWNPAAERIFGYTRERALGRDMAELIVPPEFRERHHQGIKHYVQSGEGPILGKRLELPAVRENGERLIVELITVRVPVPGPPMFTGFVRDISQLRAAQNELEKSHQRSKSLFDHNTDGVVSLALDGIFLDVNPALLEVTGYNRDDLVGQNFPRFIHERDREKVWNHFERVTQGHNQRVEFEFFHSLGHTITLQAVGIPMVVDEEVVGVYALLRDVTESNRVEERLRLLESVAVHANDAILITEAEPVDEPGPRILYANEAFTRMTGYSLEEVIGQTPRVLQGPDTSREERDKIRAALKAWKPVVVELLNYRKDGTPFWSEISIVPVCNERGWYTHWVSLQRDITARKENEAELERAREEAEEANRAKSEFLSRMSHELRTPLNAILGFGQLLEHGDLDEADQESVTHILKGGRHLLGLINEVLDIARIEAGNLSLSPEPVGLAQACGEALDLIGSMASKRGVFVDDSAARNSEIYVFADLGRFKQILINLLSNAFKYGDAGGEVSIQIETGNGRARIGVRDNGPGIAPEKMKRLWIPFDRLGAESSGTEGTGIGLTLSRTLAEAMGGTLTVESELGVGSTFWLQLPLAHDPMNAWNADSTPDAPALAFVDERFTVLCIEDNASNLNLIQKIMARRPQIQLLTATDGASGLRMARERHPDVVLLDLHLPEMPGEDVLDSLRADNSTREMPVVVVSADATPRQIERLMARGATDYLPKPFDVMQLLGTIDTLLDAGRLRAMKGEEVMAR